MNISFLTDNRFVNFIHAGVSSIYARISRIWTKKKEPETTGRTLVKSLSSSSTSHVFGTKNTAWNPPQTVRDYLDANMETIKTKAAKMARKQCPNLTDADLSEYLDSQALKTFLLNNDRLWMDATIMDEATRQILSLKIPEVLQEAMLASAIVHPLIQLAIDRRRLSARAASAGG